MIQKDIRNYLTVSEAAQKLNVSPETLRKWDRNGKLVSLKHPTDNSRIYYETQIDNFISEL